MDNMYIFKISGIIFFICGIMYCIKYILMYLCIGFVYIYKLINIYVYVNYVVCNNF